MNKQTLFTYIAVIVVTLFAIVGITNLKNNHEKLKDQLNVKSVQLKQRTVEIDTLNTELEKTEAIKQQRIDQLEQEKQALDAEKKRLEGELQAKLQRKEAERIAQASKPVPQVAAATAPVRSAPVVQGGQCPAIQAKLAALGVPADQLAAAGKLAYRESTCNEYVTNSIGACGAFQSLPCGKWGAPGTDQYYRGAIGYANGRYGGYNQALAFSLANNWY